MRRKDPAGPSQPLDLGPDAAGDDPSFAGMLVRHGRFKTDRSQNQEEPIYLEQDCQSCTKQKHFKVFVNETVDRINYRVLLLYLTFMTRNKVTRLCNVCCCFKGSF